MPNLADDLQRVSWIARLSKVIDSAAEQKDLRVWMSKILCRLELVSPPKKVSLPRDRDLPDESMVLVALWENNGRKFGSSFFDRIGRLAAIGKKLQDERQELSEREVHELELFARLLRHYLLDSRPMP